MKLQCQDAFANTFTSLCVINFTHQNVIDEMLQPRFFGHNLVVVPLFVVHIFFQVIGFGKLSDLFFSVRSKKSRTLKS